MKLFYTDHLPIPLPDGHRFPASKYALLRQRVTRLARTDLRLLPAPAASDDDLLTTHTPDYLHRLESATLSKEDVRRLGLPWSAELLQRSRHSTGATIEAALGALADGIAVNMAGGTHHAFADRPAGFCVFNDTVVAARTLLRSGAIHRALVVDTDVHQGDGTASLVAGDDRIFAFSIHGAKNYPFQKVAGDLDIALRDGVEDGDYLAALKAGLTRGLHLSRPDMIFFLAGADPFVGDRFSRLNLSKQGLLARDRLVLSIACELRIPTVVSMAGGYAKQIEDTVDIHEQTILAAAESWRQWPRETL